MAFELHPRLNQDCIEVGQFELCRLLLMNDSQYPWFILAPERPNLSEIHQLTSEDRYRLMDESCYLAENLVDLFNGDKMNIAAIGNIVPQLHIHHIVRYRTDIAWPGPIWGKFDPVPYRKKDIDEMLELLTPVITNFPK